jgi:hypothetical protein
MTDEPDPAQVMADLEALTVNLRIVFRAPERSGADHVVALQTRYVVALADNIAKFLRRSGVGNDVAERFDELAAAIDGLQRGIITDPVRPAAIGGRAPDGLTKSLLRGDVVLGLRCLEKSARMKTLKDAANYIAKNYPEFNRLKRNSDDDLAGAILSWRASIRDGRTPELEEMRGVDDKYIERLGALSSDDMFAHGERRLMQTAKRTAVTASL